MRIDRNAAASLAGLEPDADSARSVQHRRLARAAHIALRTLEPGDGDNAHVSAATQKQGELRALLTRSGSHLRELGFVTLWKPYDRSTRTPAYAHTLGLTKRFGRPELLLFGLTHEASLVTVRTLVDRYVRRGVPLPSDDPIRHVLGGIELMVKPVRLGRAAKHMPLAVEYCQSVLVPCAVQQVVMPDFAGRFPWDAHYDTSFDRYQLRLFDS